MNRARLKPLSPESVRLELTARTAFRDKLEQARNLLSHGSPAATWRRSSSSAWTC
ncbi:MAG: hypothetical protein IPI67_07760 [Myxococcales bacterium]|nr:hypothetical protein [Myxococcales bacterium]